MDCLRGYMEGKKENMKKILYSLSEQALKYKHKELHLNSCRGKTNEAAGL